MKKTTKRKITTTAKRVVKPPSQSVVLSLMALILIVGAPAIVSMIDDSYNQDYAIKYNLLDTDKSVLSSMRNSDGNIIDSVYIPASDNNGVHVLSLLDVSDASSVTFSRFTYLDMESLKNGASSVVIKTNVIPTSVKFGTNTDLGVTPIYRDMVQSDLDPYIWSIELTAVEVLKFKADVYNFVYISIGGAHSHIELEVSAFDSQLMPYAEIIIGATGAILIMCAIFATPWFGLGGITAKPRRSK